MELLTLTGRSSRPAVRFEVSFNILNIKKIIIRDAHLHMAVTIRVQQIRNPRFDLARWYHTRVAKAFVIANPELEYHLWDKSDDSPMFGYLTDVMNHLEGAFLAPREVIEEALQANGVQVPTRTASGYTTERSPGQRHHQNGTTYLGDCCAYQWRASARPD